jgi:hypothetical protein
VLSTDEGLVLLEEKKIDHFVAAYLAIEESHAQLAAELDETTSVSVAQKIRVNAETRIMQALEVSGLHVEEFKNIAELLAKNPEFRADVASRIEARTVWPVCPETTCEWLATCRRLRLCDQAAPAQ